VKEMVTKYHRDIDAALVEVGKSSKFVKKVFRGNENPIPIADFSTKKVVNYKPDVYFLLKNRFKLIFQVLESEIKKQDTLIADVVRACLVENCIGLIFIHPSEDEKDKERILESLYIVIKGLNHKGIPIDELPEKSSSYFVDRYAAENKQLVVKVLKQALEEEKWFKKS
jgi:hypothetical protein